MVTAAATIAFVVAVVLLHYEGLSLIGRTTKSRAFHHRAKILMLIFAQLGLHIVAIWIFAIGAYLLTRLQGYGAILPVPSGGFLDYVYFSAITYTTVGFGDFVPSGAVRFLAGMEALTGFVLITWSASFTFLEMQRYWDRD
jgi:hypothetical protein